MQMTHLLGETLRETPHDADLVSHRLLLRGAFIRRTSAGVYAWLPLGLRTLRRIEAIVREEMDRSGACEILMPTLVPKELFDRTGRWEDFGDELYRVTDSSGRTFGLGPTHEEIVTFLASAEINSYRQLPVIPYQFQWKFRYAPRARGGLLRGREFLMKDAYSFDIDEEGLTRSYDLMVSVYEHIFERLRLDVIRVEAHSGVIGGNTSDEFVVAVPSGEARFVECESCDYAANIEIAKSSISQLPRPKNQPLRKVHTPGRITVAEVAAFLQVARSRLVKSLLYSSSTRLICALVPGDRELNELKLIAILGDPSIRMLTDEEFEHHQIIKGYAGPVGLENALTIADERLRGGSGLVTGANETDHHLTEVEEGRDFQVDQWADLVTVANGDLCVRCGSRLRIRTGIELGHVFQLGTKYSEALDARFVDATGVSRPLVMGCYGLGISRTLATIAELHHDERGITWPQGTGPADVVIITAVSGERVQSEGKRLHDALSNHVDVLLDDRDVAAGVKFADADLIGIPHRVVVGRELLRTGEIEVIERAADRKTRVGSEPNLVLQVLNAVIGEKE